MTGVGLTPDEFDVLLEMDTEYREVQTEAEKEYRERLKEEQARNPPKRRR